MMVDGLLGYLVNAAWQAPLLAAGAWTLTRVGQLAPRGRNRVWLACLALTVVLPMVDLGATAAPPPPPPAVVANDVPTRVVALRPATATPTFIRRPAPVVAAPPRLALKLDDRVALGLLAIFAAAMAIGLARLFIGWLAVRRLMRDAVPVDLPSGVTAELAAVARAHGARAPRVRQSARTTSPVVAGAFRPVILVPVNFATRPEDELRAALLHELAHVIRRDYAVNLASEIAALPLCWHPALHAIKAEVRRSRELVCDAMASAAMRSESVYAESLVALAKSLEISPSRGASVVVGLFGKSLLEERLMHLIGPKKSQGAALKSVKLVAGGVIAAGVVGVAALLHVSTALAQSAPATASQPVAVAAAAPAEPAVITGAQTRDDAAVVIMDSNHGRYEHRWTSASGRKYDVRNDDAGEPSAADRARLEKHVDAAMDEAAKAKAMLSSPEFKAKMAEAMKAKDIALTAKMEALKALDDPQIKAQLVAARDSQHLAMMAEAEAQKALNNPEIQAEIAKARGSQHLAMMAKAEALKALDDPKIKAQIAEARAAHRIAIIANADALRLSSKALDDPKIKAEIERARRLADSPEYRKAREELKAAAEHLREVERDTR
jgi:beta-lactamase regulating signal transducer with metallopeptidase domain